MATLTGELISETYDSLLKVGDNQTITGVKKRITDGFGNTIPLLLSSTDLEIDGNFILSDLENATVDTDKFLVLDTTTVKYRTGAELLSDIGGQGSVTLTTTGTSGVATLVGDTLNIPNYADTDTGITTLNTLTALTQTFAVGSAGTDFAISSATSTHTFNLPTASASNRGALSSADWSTFNSKQGTITLTTTGTSGAATFVSNTLNIPNYGSALTGYVPYTGATTDVDLGAFKLNAQSLHVKGTAGNGHLGLKHQSASATAAASESSLFADTNGDMSFQNANLYLNKFVTSANSANRTYTFPDATGTVALVGGSGVGTVTSVAALTLGTTGSDLSSTVANGTTTPVITLQVPTASATNRGALSSADWSTFNGKQAALNGTGFVKASGTTITYDNSTYLTTTAAASTYLALAGGIMTGQIVLAAGTTSTDYTKGLRFPNDPYGGSGDTSGLRLYADTSTGAEAQVLELYVTNDVPGVSVDKINFAAPNNDLVTINDNKIWNAGNLTPQSAITLTTTGTSGAATFSANTLNIPQYADAYVGTVTSVAAITLGTSGTDLSSTVANSTTTPVITLQVPTASATNRGALSSADWTTFNNKAAALSGTINTIAYWNSATTIASLALATYPSLTELSYVKGVTSAIQTQLNAKQATITLTTTGTSGAATLVGSTLNVPNYADGGVLSLSAIGGTANANAATITGTVLNLQPASASFGGVVTTGTQTFAGAKTLTGALSGTSATFSSSVTATEVFLTGVGGILGRVGATTSAVYGYFLNTSGGLYFGAEGSAGGTVITGNPAYYAALSGVSGLSLSADNGNTVHLKIASTGAATFSSSIAATTAAFSAGSSGTIATFDSTRIGGGGISISNSGTTRLYLGNANWMGVSGEGTGSTAIALASGANSDIIFARNAVSSIAETMRITSGGNVGIGTTSPAYTLDVNGTGRFSGNITLDGTKSILGTAASYVNFGYPTETGGSSISISSVTRAGGPFAMSFNSNNGYSIGNTTGSNIFLSIASTGAATFSSTITTTATGKFGAVNIRVTSPSYDLQLVDDSAAKPSTNTWTIASDSRVKENITPYTKGLSAIMAINPVNYDYNGKAGFSVIKGNIGLIAQDVLEILPESVSTYKTKLEESDAEDTELYNFNSHALTYILINAIKELKAEIDLLKGIAPIEPEPIEEVEQIVPEVTPQTEPESEPIIPTDNNLE